MFCCCILETNNFAVVQRLDGDRKVDAWGPVRPSGAFKCDFALSVLWSILMQRFVMDELTASIRHIIAGGNPSLLY